MVRCSENGLDVETFGEQLTNFTRLNETHYILFHSFPTDTAGETSNRFRDAPMCCPPALMISRDDLPHHGTGNDQLHVRPIRYVRNLIFYQSVGTIPVEQFLFQKVVSSVL